MYHRQTKFSRAGLSKLLVSWRTPQFLSNNEGHHYLHDSEHAILFQIISSDTHKSHAMQNASHSSKKYSSYGSGVPCKNNFQKEYK